MIGACEGAAATVFRLLAAIRHRTRASTSAQIFDRVSIEGITLTSAALNHNSGAGMPSSKQGDIGVGFACCAPVTTARRVQSERAGGFARRIPCAVREEIDETCGTRRPQPSAASIVARCCYGQEFQRGSPTWGRMGARASFLSGFTGMERDRDGEPTEGAEAEGVGEESESVTDHR